MFGFAIVFLASLFNSLNPRSMMFNIVIGVVMLVKVVLGVPFYNKRTMSSLRCYFALRYLYNVVIVCPALVLLRYFTNTFLENFFVAGGILTLFELIIGVFYIRYLYKRMPLETLDDIPGLKITD